VSIAASESEGGFMKSISSTVLALVFVFFMLLSLLSVKPTWDSGPMALSDEGTRVSDIGLRITLQH
jgi:hypothetical protein